jgi:hypothetical protein
MQCDSCATLFDVNFDIAYRGPDPVATVVGYPQIQVRATDEFFEDEEAEDWLDLSPPDDPFTVLIDAYHRLGDIVTEYGCGGRGALTHSAEVINRMVFSSAIGAMEAFLGDLLIRTSMSEGVVLERLLTEENELKKMSIRLIEIHRNPNIVAEKAQAYLAGLLYHNLAKISRLYSLALKINIFPSAEIRARLQRAVITRHDIVHRNGKALSGEIIVLETDVVLSLLDDVKIFAEHVHKEVSSAVTIMGFEVLSPAENT